MDEKPLAVIQVDHDQDDYELIKKVLQDAREEFTLQTISNLDTGLEEIDREATDVVLLNLWLPNTSGLETFEVAHRELQGYPIIIITDQNDEQLALKTVQLGSQDYILKQFLNANMLSRVLRYGIERHKFMTDLEQARLQQLHMKDQFLSHVSHELRTPLTSIYQFITILLDGLAGELNPDQREYLEISLRNIVQLKTMIDDLLEVTRAQTAKLVINRECVSAYELISDSISTLKASAKAKGIHLSAEFPGDIPTIYADPQRIKAVLNNLIGNAIKFTLVGGAITVRARAYEKDKDMIRLSVSDTGVGIEPEDVDKIFEYLYQSESTLEASRKGLGLGLYICKTLVNLHGGDIWVNSKVGRGSTFSFTIPVYKPETDGE